MFINGEYWGNYYITEKYSDKYFSYYYNIPEDNVVYIKAGEVEAGNDKDQEEFNKFLSFAKGTDFTDEEEYNNLWDLLDKESTIDYFAYMLYLSRRGDWKPFQSNSGVWKSRNLCDSEYGDGKYRWVIYDMNSKGFTENLTDYDSIAYMKESSLFFNNLCKNSDFTSLLRKRINELGNTIFLEENVNSLLDGYISEVGESIKLNVERFPGLGDDAYYDGIDNYRKFFEGRRDYIEQYAQIHFE